MSSSTQRQINVYESEYDLVQLTANGYQFQIAKKVSEGPAAAAANMIWKSKAIAPKTSITWQSIYAMNWTATLPTSDNGVAVTVGGDWAPCQKGEILELTPTGYFGPSSQEPTPDWMSVFVNYAYNGDSGPQPIHIIIGQKNSAGDYDAIYASNALTVGGSGEFQPQEVVEWWYQGGNLTGSVFSKITTKAAGVDLTEPAPTTNKYAWWTTFLWSASKWVNSQTAPPAAVTAPKISAALPNSGELAPKKQVHDVDMVDLTLYPAILSVVFVIAIEVAKQAGIVGRVKQFLADHVDVSVAFDVVGKTLTVKIGPKKDAAPNSMAALGSPGESAELDKLMITLNSANYFPKGESWKITG